MADRKFEKCLIANRGEIAVRIIHACRELDIRTVVVYSDVDANALFVQLADESYALNGVISAETYLNIPKLLETASTANCDCVHPGYGFLAESAEFAEAVTDAGLAWVGPSADVIRRMGDKTEARRLMESVDVPVVPGFQSDNASDDDWRIAAEEIGYPIMVKASGGGGGKGIRIVRSDENLLDAIAIARSEADKAFGDSRIFLEKYIESARHIEFQIFGDEQGNIIHLFERECSVQRRHQKIIEEAPSQLLDDDLRERMGATAVSVVKAVGYTNAGTVEFIVTPEREFYFLEMNTRLQVEHPVTELVTGVDLVKLQFAVANGEPLPITQDDLQQRGHAIECRIYAEDPRNDFLPAIGTIKQFILPQQPGVRVDSGIQSGDEITFHYDPMIAKLIVYDSTRDQAIDRMKRSLRQMVILGLTTNREFLLNLLDGEQFRAGMITTDYVDTHLASLIPEENELPDIALIAVALSELQGQQANAHNPAFAEGDAFSPWDRSDGFRIG